MFGHPQLFVLPSCSQVDVCRRDQLAVAAGIKGAEVTAEDQEPGEDPPKKPRGRRAMKRPAASGWYQGDKPEATKRARKTKAETPPEKKESPEKSKTTRQRKSAAEKKAPAKKVSDKKKDSTAKSQTPEKRDRKRKAKDDESKLEQKASKASKSSKASATKGSVEDTQVKATFGRRNLPSREPNLTFHKSVRAAFEKHIEKLVRYPSSHEDKGVLLCLIGDFRTCLLF